MNHVTHIRNTGFIACKSYQVAILSSEINIHFRNPPHRFDLDTRKSIFEETRQWSNIVLEKNQIRQQINRISSNLKFFSELTLYHDGLSCLEYSYIARNRVSIQNYYRQYHD